MSKDDTETLGAIIRQIRKNNDWTLAEMSSQVGIPLSTLAKVEQNRLTLTYDKLVALSAKLGMQLSDLLNLAKPSAASPVIGRRSVGSIKDALRIDTPNYNYAYLCAELRGKIMTPILARGHTRSITDFGEFVRHAGEEFIFVVKGAIEVHTEFYDPVRLGEHEYIYLDSQMGHAYVLAEGCEDALVLAVCASNTDNLQQELIEQARAESLRDVGGVIVDAGNTPPKVRTVASPRRKRPALEPTT